MIVLNCFKIKCLWNQKNSNCKDTKNPLQIQGLPYSDVFTDEIQNAFPDLQQKLSELLSREQSQVESERLKLQQQRKSEPANQI